MRRFVWALCLVIVSIFRSPAAVAQPEQQPAAGDFPSRWTFHSSTGAIKVEREWVLRDGTKLKGIAILNAAELVEVQRQSSPGPGPSAAYVPLAEFTDEDQATIRAGLPSVPPEYRQYSLYQGIEVIPEWDGVKPKFPDRFNKVVDIVDDEVFFSSNTSLIGVKKSAFTAASLESITAQLKQAGRQIVLDPIRSPITVIGQPIHETEDEFVMEVTMSYPYPGLEGYVPGKRYILPKASIGASLVSQVKQVCELVRKESKATAPTTDELRNLSRLCNTTSGACLIKIIDAKAEAASVRRHAGLLQKSHRRNSS